VSLRFFFCTIVLILVAQEILFKDYSLSLADARYFNNTDLLSVGIKPFIVMASGYYAALLVSSRFEKFVFNKVLSRNGGIGLSNKIRS